MGELLARMLELVGWVAIGAVTAFALAIQVVALTAVALLTILGLL